MKLKNETSSIADYLAGDIKFVPLYRTIMERARRKLARQGQRYYKSRKHPDMVTVANKKGRGRYTLDSTDLVLLLEVIKPQEFAFFVLNGVRWCITARAQYFMIPESEFQQPLQTEFVPVNGFVN